MLRRAAIAAVIAAAAPPIAFLAGCTPAPPPSVVIVRKDDPKMVAAITRARGSLPTFLAALQHPKPMQRHFAVKARFTDSNAAEYMWLTDVTYASGHITGTLADTPFQVHGMWKGERGTVPISDVADWAFRDGSRLVGGFTEPVLQQEKQAGEAVR